MKMQKNGPVKVSVTMLECPELITLEGLQYSDTIGNIKVKACQIASDMTSHLFDPDGTVMILVPFGFLHDELTLGFLSSCDRRLDSTSFSFGCTSLAFEKLQELAEEEMYWLAECESTRLREEAANSDDVKHIYPFSDLKRPQTNVQLPYGEFSNLGIDGDLELYDMQHQLIPITKIERVACARTTASLVLLASNDRILEGLRSMNSLGKSKYLVLRISWDILSYIIVRKLRASFRDTPFVAVTDLDPSHLDLLAFLDTPPSCVQCCYGWNLDTHCSDACVYSVEFVDINWLGLRPCDCISLLTPDGIDAYARPPPRDFHKVIRMISVNPFLRKKKDWVQALEWLQDCGRCVSFQPLGPSDECHLYLGDDFIPKKLSAKEWI